MAYEAKFIIAAENRVKQGLDDAKKDLTGFSDAAENIGKRLKEALTVTAIVVGFEKLGKAAFDCFVEFGEGERRIKQLKIALDNNETSFSRATRLIDEMRGMSLASKDQIEGLVAELATLGKSDAEIDRITRAAVNLSNVTGQDLNSAFTLINGTFTGTAGKLEKLIPQIGDLKKEQLEAGGAVDLINGKFGEMSAQLAENNIPQKIKNIQDAWGDFKENLGEAVAPIFNPILEGINRIIEGWNNAAKAAKLHDQILTSSSYTQKIALTQSLLETQKEQLRLFDQGIGGKTIERIQKQLTSRDLDPQTKMMLQESLDVWQGQRDAIVSAINVSEATITDLKRIWQKIPAGKLAPQDLIPTVSLLGQPTSGAGGAMGGAGGGTGTSGSTGTTSSQASDFFSDSWTRHYQALGEQFTSTLSQASSYISDSWSRHYQKAAEAYNEVIASNVPEMDFWHKLFILENKGEGEFGAFPELPTSQASDYVSDSWSRHYEVAFKSFSDSLDKMTAGVDYQNMLMDNFSIGTEEAVNDFNSAREQLRKIKEYWDEHPLTGAELARSEGMNRMGRIALGIEAPNVYEPSPADTYRELMTEQEYQWSLAMNKLGESILNSFSQASDYVSDSWSRHYQKLGEIWQEEKNTLALMEKFAPTTSGQYSMSGWKMGYQLWQLQTENQYKDPLAGKGFARQFETALEPLKRTLGEKISDLGVKLYNWGNNNGGTVGNIVSGAGIWLTGAGLGLDNIFGAIGGLAGKFWGLIESVSSLRQILDPITTILKAALQVIQPMLDTILTPIVGILQILGQTIGQMLLPVLQALAPVIKFLGDAFVWLYNNVIGPVGNLMFKIFATIWNAIASAINSLLGWLGVHLGTIDTSIDVLKKIDAGALQTAGASAVGQTAAQSASYRSQSITINIYQEAPVVGSGGMTEFARIIRGEFERLGYYGA